MPNLITVVKSVLKAVNRLIREHPDDLTYCTWKVALPPADDSIRPDYQYIALTAKMSDCDIGFTLERYDGVVFELHDDMVNYDEYDDDCLFIDNLAWTVEGNNKEEEEEEEDVHEYEDCVDEDEDEEDYDYEPNRIWSFNMPNDTCGEIEWKDNIITKDWKLDVARMKLIVDRVSWEVPYSCLAGSLQLVPTQAALSEHRNNMLDMLSRGREGGADLCIRTRDGDDLWVHSYVVEACCEYFRDLKRTRLAAGQNVTTPVDALLFGSAAVRSTLEFIYACSSTVCSADVLPEVLHAATCFMLPALHEACLDFARIIVAKRCNLDTKMLHMWVSFARDHNETILKEIADAEIKRRADEDLKKKKPKNVSSKRMKRKRA